MYVQVYTAIHDELVSGGRVYIVCPLVYENEDLEGVKAAEDEHQRLQESGLFGDFKCGLLHGKMKGEEKAAVLKAFSRYAVITSFTHIQFTYILMYSDRLYVCCRF